MGSLDSLYNRHIRRPQQAHQRHAKQTPERQLLYTIATRTAPGNINVEFLHQYYDRVDDTHFSVSAAQGSEFAKRIAGDFNPIHDPDSKRFCVPGDLLFAIALERYGLHQTMGFKFLDLIGADTRISYPSVSPAQSSTTVEVVNESGKPVLGVEYSGVTTYDSTLIEQLLKSYVAFSGHNFPDILVPLMQQHDVMVNPQRPLVIYQSMAFEFDRLDFTRLDVSLESTTLEVSGKRGNARLGFALQGDGLIVGAGVKNLVLSGLRDYDEHAMTDMCQRYEASRQQ